MDTGFLVISSEIYDFKADFPIWKVGPKIIKFSGKSALKL